MTTNVPNVRSVPIHAVPVYSERSTPVHSVPTRAALPRAAPVHPAPAHVVDEFTVHTSLSYPNNGPRHHPVIHSYGPHPLDGPAPVNANTAASTSHQLPTEHHVPGGSTMFSGSRQPPMEYPALGRSTMFPRSYQSPTEHHVPGGSSTFSAPHTSHQIPTSRPLNLGPGNEHPQNSGPPPYSQPGQAHGAIPLSRVPNSQTHPPNSCLPVSTKIIEIEESDCEEGGGSGDENNYTFKGVPGFPYNFTTKLF